MTVLTKQEEPLSCLRSFIFLPFFSSDSFFLHISFLSLSLSLSRALSPSLPLTLSTSATYVPYLWALVSSLCVCVLCMF